MHKNTGNNMKTFCGLRLEVELSIIIGPRPLIHLFIHPINI